MLTEKKEEVRNILKQKLIKVRKVHKITKLWKCKDIVPVAPYAFFSSLSSFSNTFKNACYFYSENDNIIFHYFGFDTFDLKCDIKDSRWVNMQVCFTL